MSDRTRKITRREALKLGAGAGAAALVGGGLAAAAAYGTGEGAASDAAARAAAAAAAGEGPAGSGAAAADAAPLPEVPRRVLGKTGVAIPILLMGGAVKLDPRFDPKLAEGLRFGVDYIDAADCYGGGSCEAAVGSFLQKGVPDRRRIWITSKSDRHDPAGFEATLLAGLEKMQTDYFDMYFLHALEDASVLNDDLRRTVARLEQEGKFRFFGFSCHAGNVDRLLARAAELPWIDAVMFRYNFRQYGNARLNRAMDACAKAGVGMIAMKTQASEASFHDAWKKFEQTGKWTKHQAVLKAVWADERISAAVSHMDSFEKLKQNIAAALDATDLGQAGFEALERYAAATRAQACDGCDHLCGAAVGAPVEIGATLRFLMYHDTYGEPEKARRLFGALPPAARRLAGVDFAAASAACPHGVDVAAHMARAAKVLAA